MYKIWFTSYNEGEMWDPRDFEPLEVVRIWSEYEDRQVMEEVGCTPLQVLSARDVRKTMHDNGDILFDGDDGEHGDLFLMKFDNMESARTVFRLWLVELRSREENRGADDGTYDYYPDAWFVTWQIAKGLKMQKEYNAAVDELLKNTEYGTDALMSEHLIRKIEE